MSTAYKVDERVVRNIVDNNVTCVGNNKVQLITYYKTKKVSNYIMKNSPNEQNHLKHANVIYQFKCPNADCRLRQMNYIGMTTTSLSRRLTMHLRDGAPKNHYEEAHHQELTRQILTQNTTILDTCNDRRRLQILEAMYIREIRPQLNKQVNSCITLALYKV